MPTDVSVLAKRTISSAFETYLEGSEHNLFLCLKISLYNGDEIYITNCEIDITYDSNVYSSDPGMELSNIEETGDLEVDNVSVVIPYDDNVIPRDDMFAGKFENAAWILYCVDVATPDTYNMIVSAGVFGKIKMQDIKCEIELLSYIELLQYDHLGCRISQKCRARLGDSKCQVNLGYWTAAGIITTVYSQSSFQAYIQEIQGDPFLDQWQTVGSTWFTYGHFVITNQIPDLGIKVSMESGSGKTAISTSENESLRRMIRSYSYNSGRLGTFVLSRSLPYTLQEGECFYVTAGCNKSTTQCNSRFNNLYNFYAEPDIPGRDKITGSYG